MPRKSESRPRQGRSAAHRSRRPTINDVARLADVSKKTVSRVINNSPYVRGTTRTRVGEAIAELGFSPDPQARGLAIRRSMLVGLIMDDPLPPDTGAVQQQVLGALRGTGFELVVRALDRGNPRLLNEVRAFVEGQRLFAVLLLRATPAEPRLTALLRELDCPFAEISRERAAKVVDNLIALSR